MLDDGGAKIRQGKIKVVPNFRRTTTTGVEFEDNREEDFDAIIFATGYRSAAPRWLKNSGELFSDDGFPRKPSPDNWKGREGLYAAGLGRAGLLGSSMDSRLIAQDIFQAVKHLNPSSGQIGDSVYIHLNLPPGGHIRNSVSIRRWSDRIQIT